MEPQDPFIHHANEAGSARSIRLFISYHHESDEHKDRVCDLSDRLRDDGIDCYIDQYEHSLTDWPVWMLEQVKRADFVLLVCTKTYRARFEGEEKAEVGRGGVEWEGAIVTQSLYAAQNRKFIPVYFSPDDAENIPLMLRGANRYDVSTEAGYQALYRLLTNQPNTIKPKLGTLRPMPPRQRKPSHTHRVTPAPSAQHAAEPRLLWVQPRASEPTLSLADAWPSTLSPFLARAPVSQDTDLLIGRDMHWDRELVTESFLGMVQRQKKHPWRVVALQGREAGLDSLVDRFEKMCREAKRRPPLLYARAILRS